MKKIGRILLAIAFLLVCVLASNQSFATTYDGLWVPNDKDMVALQVGIGFGQSGLYMYDFDTPSKSMLLVNGTPGLTIINFANVNGSWMATTTSGGSLDLGSNENFGFYFEDSNGNKSFSYDLVELAPGDAYRLSSASMNVFVDDATVPEPTTMLLLGAGLLGFVFFGRRLKKV